MKFLYLSGHYVREDQIVSASEMESGLRVTFSFIGRENANFQVLSGRDADVVRAFMGARLSEYTPSIREAA